MKVEYLEIVIEWENYNSDTISEKYDKKDKGQYLYCVYCDSHIYGRDVLAYIGKTNNYEVRNNQHLKSFFKFANNVRFVIGFLDKSLDNIEVAESILIANHKPYYNKEFIHDLCPEAKSQKIIILNNGNHGMLKNSVTNYWWVTNEEYSIITKDAEKNTE